MSFTYTCDRCGSMEDVTAKASTEEDDKGNVFMADLCKQCENLKEALGEKVAEAMKDIMKPWKDGFK